MKHSVSSIRINSCFTFLLPLIITLLSLSITTGDDEANEAVREFTYVTTHLTNSRVIPLIGIGVADVRRKNVPTILRKTIGDSDLQYDLIDTSRKSGNEKIISSTISSYPRLKEGRDVHVITKIWYTHLGYDRTKLTVKRSLDDLQPNVKLHVVLAWPRCYDQISASSCEEEESDLPQFLKDLGPSPLLDPNTFLDSWRAMEELYLHHQDIISIGVANFDVGDWRLLLDNCNIVPHIHQGDVFTFFENTALMQILDDNRVLYQVTNILQLITAVVETPNAEARLREHAVNVGVANIQTMIVAWFLQHRVGVVVNGDEADDTAITVMSPPIVGPTKSLEADFDYLTKIFHHVVSQLEITPNTSGNVVVTFVNNLKRDVKVFWVNEEENIMDHVHSVTADSTTDIASQPGHKFVVKHDENSEVLKTFEVRLDRGGWEQFHIDEF